MHAQAAPLVHYMFHWNAYDVSGNGYDGTVVGSPGYNYEQQGASIQFNNPTGEATQFVTLPDLTPVLQNSSFTIAVKYRTTDSAGNNGRLYGNTWIDSGVAFNYNAGNRPAPNGLITQDGNYSLFGNFADNGTPVTTDGQWHRAVLSVNRSTQTMNFYVDNSLVSSGPLNSTAGINFANFAVGALGVRTNGENTSGAKAAVDDFQIFNSALTESQIGQINEGFLTNNNPANQIRFSTPAQADAKRSQLTNYIWPNGLPTNRLPTVTKNVAFPNGDLNGLNQSLVASVDKIDSDVSGMDFHSTSYLIHPANGINANKLLIVHQGHAANTMDYSIRNSIEKALEAGYSVIAMAMPLMGWNTDTSLSIDGTTYSLTYGDHNSIFSNLKTALPDGGAFRLFVEPIVQNINYFKSLPGAGEVAMTGVSGGGWSTHMAAAVDTRIQLAVPVAGSAPLYSRNEYGPDFVGDAPEQYYTPLFREDIAEDGSGGGVATWQEIYALGGYGEGRKEVMVTALYDNICFYGDYADAFKEVVADKVASLGAGSWEYYGDPVTTMITNSDGYQTTHQISPATMQDIVLANMATMGVPEPSTLLLAGMAACGLVILLKRRARESR